MRDATIGVRQCPGHIRSGAMPHPEVEDAVLRPRVAEVNQDHLRTVTRDQRVQSGAEATASRSGGGLPALVVEVAAGGQASGSTSGCVNRTGLPSDRA